MVAGILVSPLRYGPQDKYDRTGTRTQPDGCSRLLDRRPFEQARHLDPQGIQHPAGPLDRDPVVAGALVARHLRRVDAQPRGQLPLRDPLGGPQPDEELAQSMQVEQPFFSPDPHADKSGATSPPVSLFSPRTIVVNFDWSDPW